MDSNNLVGRDEELGRLDAALAALDEGVGGCVTVEGEPGIGKSRLLGELRPRAEKRGFAVLWGVAAEFERDRPFSVWVDALDPYAAAQDLSEHDAWNAALATELAQVLPSLASAAPASDGAIPDERYRIHRAVRSLLGLLAENQAIVIVLDDMHWSDRASIELLASLIRRELSAPVLFALGFRTGQMDGRLVAAVAAPSVDRLRLEPLSEAQAAELLADVPAASATASG